MRKTPARKSIAEIDLIMNILQLCQWDFAGCGITLSNAINAHTEHHSRHIVLERSRLEYPYDVLKPTSQQILVLYRWADVIHIHDAFAKIPKNFAGKPTVVTYHGSRYRKSPPKFHQKIKANGWVGTVATPDLTVHGLPWLPDCRPGYLKGYVNRTKQPSIAHSPTKRKTKGTHQVIQALLGKYNVDIIEGVTWDECLTRRGKAHISIDQFRAGYGCSSIEAWVMSQPVIAGGTPQVMESVKRCVGYVPFYYCPENSTEIRESVRDLLENPDVYEQTVKMGYQCWRENHSPKAVTERVLPFYEQAQDEYIGLQCAAPDPEKTAVVRYLGYPTQIQTFSATATGTQYKYGGEPGQREILIDQRDLPEFLAAKAKGNKRLWKLIRRN